MWASALGTKGAVGKRPPRLPKCPVQLCSEHNSEQPRSECRGTTTAVARRLKGCRGRHGAVLMNMCHTAVEALTSQLDKQWRPKDQTSREKTLKSCFANVHLLASACWPAWAEDGIVRAGIDTAGPAERGAGRNTAL